MILITGSNGFLGTRVVDALLKKGVRDIQCLVRPGSDQSALQAVLGQDTSNRAKVIVGNLASVEAASKVVQGATTIFHVAATLRGSAADMCLGTVVASNNLLQAVTSAAPGAQIVLVSSFGVYGVANLPRGAVIDEETPLESQARLRDSYSRTKLRQEQLFRDYAQAHGTSLVILRPGVIYGPQNQGLSARIGLQLPGLFLELGGRNPIPLSFVDNCADAIVTAGIQRNEGLSVYNVHDDDLPTCERFFAEYQKYAGKVRSVRVPYPVLQAISRIVQKYHHYSGGQLPDVFTPYKTASTWKAQSFSNAKLKGIGWRPHISTEQGLKLTFESLRSSNAGGRR